MTFARLARVAVLGWAVAMAGCAAVAPVPSPSPASSPSPAPSPAPPPAPASPASAAVTLVTPQEHEQQSPTLGVRIEIEAPGELKALLEQYLDLVRLGSLPREDVDDTEWARLIDASPAQVRELLQTEGYFSPQVRIERQPGRAEGQPDRVRLLVEPGPQARVERLTLEVEGELERGATGGDAYATATLAAWRRAWELPEGAPFRNPSWSEAKAAALARLRAAGYATAVWSGTTAAVDAQANTVRLFLVADSGPLFRLGRIQIEGLVAQDADTVRNLAFTRLGRPVTEALLLDFQERLQKSALFETVNVTLEPDPATANAATVNVRLREAPLQQWTFGVGVSANTGARASVQHLWKRVFGLPASSNVKIEVGEKRQAWDAELSGRVNEGLYRNLVGGQVERLLSDTDIVVQQSVRLGRAQDTQRLERLFYAGFDRSSREILSAGGRKTALAYSLNFHGGWRDLDSVLLPTHGEALQIQLGAGHAEGTDAASGGFGRAYGRLVVYRPIAQRWYGQARIELGRVFLGSRMVVPEQLKWRAGGDESVRGYGFRDLGPVVDGAVGGGLVIGTASVELARPFLDNMPSLWGAVFVDAGNAAQSLGELKPVYGYGVGVRWRSPVGPLRLDWAYGSETRKGRLHFSVGIAF